MFASFGWRKHGSTGREEKPRLGAVASDEQQLSDGGLSLERKGPFLLRLEFW
jgi:hypothetical protein